MSQTKDVTTMPHIKEATILTPFCVIVISMLRNLHMRMKSNPIVPQCSTLLRVHEVTVTTRVRPNHVGAPVFTVLALAPPELTQMEKPVLFV